MIVILLACWTSSKTLLLGHALGSIARGHPISQRHAPRVDRWGALMLLSIQTDRYALQPLAPRGGTRDGHDRDQEGLAAELSQRPEGRPGGVGIGDRASQDH